MRALILAPFSEFGLARLRSRMEVVYESWLDTRRIYDPEDLGARIAAELHGILIVEADFVFEETFDAAPGLRFAGICRNALNHVDIDAATRRGVVVTHARGRNTTAVVELTLSLLLSLFRRVPAAHAFVASGSWDDPAAGSRSFLGREIAGSTIGVVGFGQIGRRVAAALLALDARVIVHDALLPDGDVRAAGCEPAPLASLAAASDAITLHTPPGVRVADKAFLGTMQRHAFLVNTGSGAAVEAETLVEALREGRIAGAALDVFEGQPLPRSSPLLTAPNLLLTPHIGGATAETVERQSAIMCEEIERFLDGSPMQYVVNPEVLRADVR